MNRRSRIPSQQVAEVHLRMVAASVGRKHSGYPANHFRVLTHIAYGVSLDVKEDSGFDILCTVLSTVEILVRMSSSESWLDQCRGVE